MPDITNVLSALGQETRLDILRLLSDAPEAGLASGSIATELNERREPADIADVVALRLVAEAPYIHLVDETLLATGGAGPLVLDIADPPKMTTLHRVWPMPARTRQR